MTKSALGETVPLSAVHSVTKWSFDTWCRVVSEASPSCGLFKAIHEGTLALFDGFMKEERLFAEEGQAAWVSHVCANFMDFRRVAIEVMNRKDVSGLPPSSLPIVLDHVANHFGLAPSRRRSSVEAAKFEGMSHTVH